MSRKPAGGRPASAPPGTLDAGTGPPPAGLRGAGPAGAPAGEAGQGRRQPWRAVFFALAAVAIVAGVAWALLGSRFFVVRGVAVTGTHLVSPAQVRAAAAIPFGLPLVRVNTAAAARRVEQIPQVRSAQVSIAWPDRVRVSVTERTPVLAVHTGQGYELVDADGVAVRAAATAPAGMPLLVQPAGEPVAALRGSAAVHAAAVIVRELPRFLSRSLATVRAPSATDVSFTLRSGVSIVWGGTDRPAVKARELTVLMRTHARRYDVSAPGTAVTGG